MDATLRRSTAWALLAAGAVGILLALATLPTVWAVVSGNARFGWALEIGLPRWAQWHHLSLTGVHLVLGGLLCGMLIVAGGCLARLLALASLVWFVGATAALASGSYWVAWMANSGDGTPLSVQVTGNGVVLVALSATAILAARTRLKRSAATPETIDPNAGASPG